MTRPVDGAVACSRHTAETEPTISSVREVALA
jgi:hypothetical protein